MLTPLLKPSRLTSMNFSAGPWNQVAFIQPSGCQTVLKRSQSPASRHKTQFSTVSRIANFSAINASIAYLRNGKLSSSLRFVKLCGKKVRFSNRGELRHASNRLTLSKDWILPVLRFDLAVLHLPPCDRRRVSVADLPGPLTRRTFPFL